MRSVSAQALVLRNRRVTWASSCANSSIAPCTSAAARDVVADQRLVERALADLLGGFVAERIVAVFLQRLAQRVQDLAKRALAGAVAEKAVIVLQFDIEAVHVHRRQPGRAVPGDARGRQCIFSHFAPALSEFGGTTAGNPLVSWRRWRVASSEWILRLAIRQLADSPFWPKSLIFGRFSARFP